MTAFSREPIVEIIAWVERELARAGEVAFEVLDPDRGRGRFAGELVAIDGASYVHRPFRVWVDLAERLGARLLTPRVHRAPLIELRLERLDPDARWAPPAAAASERYGAGSGFERLAKAEDPGFVVDLREALARVALAPGARVLDLGVNTGDELALVEALAPGLDLRFVGIDHSASALAVARGRFPAERVTLIEADLAALPALALGRFDLVLSIGTLQSSGLDDRAVVRQVVQEHLAPDGAVIFGFPNCRYIDGEIEFGARMKNFRQPELGLVIKDLAFYRKYLQQHRRRVFVTGKHYLLVTGVAIAGPDEPG